MTVQDVTSEVSFTGTGAQTSFVFNYRVDDVAWLTLSYLTSFNMVILNGDQEISPGGSIEYFVAPPIDQQIVLTRNVPLTQLVDYTRHGPFDSESHEGALDKLTMAIQDRDKNTAQKSKSATLENPINAEDVTLFFTPVALTVSEIRAVLRGASTPSVTWTIRHDLDRNAVGTEIVTGGTVTTDITTGDDITVMDDASIPADSFIWLETTAKSGTVQALHITIRYTEELP
jgi:hypothetical protein